MGSGKLLLKAITKYGVENFRKHIIAECASDVEALELERKIVDEEFLANDNVYNLTTGGGGDWNHVNKDDVLRTEKNHRAGLTTMTKIWSDPEWRMRKFVSMSEQAKRLHSEGILHPHDWTGREHRAETKEKIGRANAVKQKGERNSQYGKVWLHHDIRRESLAVERSTLEEYINCGWVVGRKMKW